PRRDPPVVRQSAGEGIHAGPAAAVLQAWYRQSGARGGAGETAIRQARGHRETGSPADRKSTRLNSSHDQISYAVFCLKKKIMHAALAMRDMIDIDSDRDSRAALVLELLRISDHQIL